MNKISVFRDKTFQIYGILKDTDVLSPENRHKNMSHIRSKDTKPEKQIRSALKKFERNKERDAENLKFYQDKCWRVCVVWECAIRGKNSRQKIEAVKDQIIQWLEESGELFLEIMEN